MFCDFPREKGSPPRMSPQAVSGCVNYNIGKISRNFQGRPGEGRGRGTKAREECWRIVNLHKACKHALCSTSFQPMMIERLGIDKGWKGNLIRRCMKAFDMNVNERSLICGVSY